jgi:hypothetical protein
MKDGFLTLEDGDWIERNYAERIRKTIPLYEIIWSRYIGNDGNGHPLPMPGLSKEREKEREKFYQAHYSAMVAVIHLQDIADEYQNSLGRVTSVFDYVHLLRDIASFMCFVGRVRDMMKKMDGALKLGGEVGNKFTDLYRKRSNYLHGPIPAQQFDPDGLVSMAVPGGVSHSEADWLDESLWSDSEHKRFEEVADFMRDTLGELLREVHAASSRILDALDATMPSKLVLTCPKPWDESALLKYGMPTRRSWTHRSGESTAASGVVTPPY